MNSTENMIVIYVPETLIVGLRELVGPVHLNLNKLLVEDGFALAPDEYVTSLRVQKEAEVMAGISHSCAAIIISGAELPI